MWSAVLVMGVLLSASGQAFGVRGRREDSSLWRNPKRVDFPENCTYPCACPGNQRDCEECLECPRQVGEPCSQHKLCDSRRGIFCKYRHGDSEGICQESGGLPCLVYNKTYEHRETFSLDCRTQCTCQNGTYGCSSLCPQERISPKGTCKHPRLVDVPGQCCREWMCDSQTAEEPPSCQPIFSKWSTCSSDCGAGLSSRTSNLNVKCESATETRICQTRRCDDFTPEVFQRKQHHVRAITADERKALFSPNLSECMCATGVDPFIVQQWIDKGIYTNDACFKCFLKCLLMKIGEMNSDGTFNIPQTAKNHKIASESVQFCLGQFRNQTDLCQLAYDVEKCLEPLVL